MYAYVCMYVYIVNILLPKNPTIALFGIYSNELKMYDYAEICT